jgi:hypothetical protein
LLLAFGTLIIYWVDHVLDSQNALLVQTNKRHWVFKKYKPFFCAAIIALICINAYFAIMFLSKLELLAGLVLLAFLAIYLFYHKKLMRIFILEKELLISSLYVVSVLFAPTAIINAPLASYSFVSMLFVGLNLMLLTLQSLFSIAIMERKMDKEYGIKNITQIYGSSKLRDVQGAMMLLQLTTSSILWILHPTNFAFNFCVVLLLISYFQYSLPRLFKDPQNDTYRILADGVFLLVLLV